MDRFPIAFMTRCGKCNAPKESGVIPVESPVLNRHPAKVVPVSVKVSRPSGCGFAPTPYFGIRAHVICVPLFEAPRPMGIHLEAQTTPKAGNRNMFGKGP